MRSRSDHLVSAGPMTLRPCTRKRVMAPSTSPAERPHANGRAPKRVNTGSQQRTDTARRSAVHCRPLRRCVRAYRSGWMCQGTFGVKFFAPSPADERHFRRPLELRRLRVRAHLRGGLGRHVTHRRSAVNHERSRRGRPCRRRRAHPIGLTGARRRSPDVPDGVVTNGPGRPVGSSVRWRLSLDGGSRSTAAGRTRDLRPSGCGRSAVSRGCAAPVRSRSRRRGRPR